MSSSSLIDPDGTGAPEFGVPVGQADYGTVEAEASHAGPEARGVPADGHLDRRPGRRVPQGVHDQVRHDLAQPALVTEHDDRAQLPAEPDDPQAPVGLDGAGVLRHVGRDHREIDRRALLRPLLVEPGEREQVLHQRAQAAALVEMFPTRVRYTAMSLPYHVGTGWIGGFLPVTSFALATITGDIYASLWYAVFFTAVPIAVSLIFLKETRGKPLEDV